MLSLSLVYNENSNFYHAVFVRALYKIVKTEKIDSFNKLINLNIIDAKQSSSAPLYMTIAHYPRLKSTRLILRRQHNTSLFTGARHLKQSVENPLPPRGGGLPSPLPYCHTRAACITHLIVYTLVYPHARTYTREAELYTPV